MAYYPSNFYSSYNYNIPQPQYQQSVYPQQMPQVQMGLQGKIVESEDIVKVTDIPIGGYGIFPKADLSEIYIKTWNGNGTTNIMTFQPVVKQEAVKEENNNNNNNIVLEKIQCLEEKIDTLLKSPVSTLPQTTTVRKEF